jgi:uncharacterized protein YceH (UPF0502 family)
MAATDEPLVVEVPRKAGQKENRWIHLVGEIAEPSPAEAPREPAGSAASAPAGSSLSLTTRVQTLEETVARLAEELAKLKGDLGV